jgi:hypothetical protein
MRQTLKNPVGMVKNRSMLHLKGEEKGEEKGKAYVRPLRNPPLFKALEVTGQVCSISGPLRCCQDL